MYKVGIIGLGSIAARYAKPADAYPYCHTGGIRFCDSTELVAVADLSQERRDEFRETWGPAFPPDSINYYESDVEMLGRESLDIVAVCVRGPHHYKVAMEVLKADIKSIFLEKPMGCSLTEVDEMTRIADAKGIPIVVSYSRHWAPSSDTFAEAGSGWLSGRRSVRDRLLRRRSSFVLHSHHRPDLPVRWV